MDFYTSIKNLYKQIYFNIEESFPEISWDRIVSNKVLQLPASCLNEAQGFISAFYKLSQTASYQEATGLKKQFPFDENIKNHSLLMAYDFHVDDQNNLKLIEVNTNASGYLLADLVYTSMSNTSSLDSLKSSFLSELELSHHPSEKKIFIVDENISQQKMIFEFYMYKALFEQWGFNSKIVEFSQLHWDDSKKALFDNDQPVDFIYNRYCDFLLQKEVSSHLLNGFSQNVTLSPNPIHYFLLADKERLLELSDPLWAEQMLDQKALSLYEKIKDNLILTYPIHSFTSREDLWEKRKNLFFKPKRSHGGKATYRGKNITKKVFDSFNDQDFLVQQFVPAPEAQFEDGKWKYELRFFVYQDTIQLVSPRFYNGQVMNFNLSGGGFGRVEFT